MAKDKNESADQNQAAPKYSESNTPASADIEAQKKDLAQQRAELERERAELAEERAEMSPPVTAEKAIAEATDSRVRRPRRRIDFRLL